MFKTISLSLMLLWPATVLAEEPVMEEIIVVGEEKSLWDFSKLREYEKQHSKYRTLRFSANKYYWGGAIGDFYQVSQNTYLGLEIRQQHDRFREPFDFDKYTGNNIIRKREFIAISINFHF